MRYALLLCLLIAACDTPAEPPPVVEPPPPAPDVRIVEVWNTRPPSQTNYSVNVRWQNDGGPGEWRARIYAADGTMTRTTNPEKIMAGEGRLGPQTIFFTNSDQRPALIIAETRRGIEEDWSETDRADIP